MGKTHWVLRQIERYTRVAIWDPKMEYAAHYKTRELDQFLYMLGTEPRGELVAAFCPRRISPRVFELFCRGVMAWGHCLAVVDELATVSTPAKAPPGWGELLREGRHHAVHVIGISQRAAESDKTIMGNLTELVVFRAKRHADRIAAARELDIDVELLAELKPRQWYIRSDTDQAARFMGA